jgi:SAM-dependent methyltransferase
MTQLLLPHCGTVYAVEPNDGMRLAAEDFLGNDPRLISIKGTAESTTLGERCVDLIVTAQAFHWFDRTRAKKEFRRILRGEGWTALIWNNRLADADAFHRELEQLFLDKLEEYHRVRHRDVPIPELAEFFSPGTMTEHVVSNQQEFDLEGFEGRVLSASYVPPKGDPQHDAFMKLVRELFNRHQTGGRVTMRYATAIYLGKLPFPRP